MGNPQSIDVQVKHSSGDACTHSNSNAKPKIPSHVLSRAVSETKSCRHFISKWDSYKHLANEVVNTEKISGKDYVAPPGSEIAMHSDGIQKLWFDFITKEMSKRAKDSDSSVEELPKTFAKSHVEAIIKLGYTLNEEEQAALSAALERFYLCDIGPAPFSAHEVADANLPECCSEVTVSEHCLQMATHWVRHPPACFTIKELEELVVLSLFHDVYYYDDFVHHGSRALELLKPWVTSDTVAELIGDHIHLECDDEAVQSLQFATPLDALKQEWVQMGKRYKRYNISMFKMYLTVYSRI